MAVSFNSIYGDVLSQINSLDATTVTILQAAYAAALAGTITDADMNSTDWATGQIQNAILDTEYEIIKEICFNPRHPERGDFRITATAQASATALPSASSGSVPFLGPYDYAIETGSAALIKPRSFAVVSAAIRNANSAFSSPYRPLAWCADGGTLLHNSDTTVALVGAGIARATFSGNIRCRDYHRPAIVAGSLVRLLPKEGQWQDAFGANSALYTAHIEQIRSVGQQAVTPFTGQ